MLSKRISGFLQRFEGKDFRYERTKH